MNMIFKGILCYFSEILRWRGFKHVWLVWVLTQSSAGFFIYLFAIENLKLGHSIIKTQCQHYQRCPNLSSVYTFFKKIIEV